MDNKNFRVAGADPAGALAGGPATEHPAAQVVIRKFGRGMNSRKFERRYLYLYISPFDGDDLETGVRKAVDALNKLLVAWEPPVRRGFFRPDMWWQHEKCPYCLRRFEYENKMWQANAYVWRRNMCLRHWFAYHLSMISPDEPTDWISNRPIDIVADDKLIRFGIETVNYKYSVLINREHAVVDVEYKGKQYKFGFKNHSNGFPYISSYMNMLVDIYNALELFRDFLTDYVLKRRVYSNVVINDTFTIPPARDDVVGCGACRL
jgi:hypothetical protein